MAEGKKKVFKKKKEKKNIQDGIAHIQSTFNNTIITITDMNGNVIAWSSSGVKGFKGSRKSTPYAAQQSAEDAAKKAMLHGLKNIEVYVKGPGAGREAAHFRPRAPDSWRIGRPQRPGMRHCVLSSP